MATAGAAATNVVYTSGITFRSGSFSNQFYQEVVGFRESYQYQQQEGPVAASYYQYNDPGHAEQHYPPQLEGEQQSNYYHGGRYFASSSGSSQPQQQQQSHPQIAYFHQHRYAADSASQYPQYSQYYQQRFSC